MKCSKRSSVKTCIISCLKGGWVGFDWVVIQSIPLLNSIASIYFVVQEIVNKTEKIAYLQAQKVEQSDAL